MGWTDAPYWRVGMWGEWKKGAPEVKGVRVHGCRRGHSAHDKLNTLTRPFSKKARLDGQDGAAPGGFRWLMHQNCTIHQGILSTALTALVGLEKCPLIFCCPPTLHFSLPLPGPNTFRYFTCSLPFFFLYFDPLVGDQDGGEYVGRYPSGLLIPAPFLTIPGNDLDISEHPRSKQTRMH